MPHIHSSKCALFDLDYTVSIMRKIAFSANCFLTLCVSPEKVPIASTCCLAAKQVQIFGSVGLFLRSFEANFRVANYQFSDGKHDLLAMAAFSD